MQDQNASLDETSGKVCQILFVMNKQKIHQTNYQLLPLHSHQPLHLHALPVQDHKV